MTWAWTAATPGTARSAARVRAGKSPPAVKPAPEPMPAPATEIWPRTNRCPPSMNRLIRSASAPRATSPAIPTAIPATAKP